MKDVNTMAIEPVSYDQNVSVPPHLTKAVFEVGDGRGFLVNDLIITAAHCLPANFPDGCYAPFSDLYRFPNLIGHIGGVKTVDAEAIFIEPVNDIAILRAVDDDYENWLRLFSPSYSARG